MAALMACLCPLHFEVTDPDGVALFYAGISQCFENADTLQLPLQISEPVRRLHVRHGDRAFCLPPTYPIASVLAPDVKLALFRSHPIGTHRRLFRQPIGPLSDDPRGDSLGQAWNSFSGERGDRHRFNALGAKAFTQAGQLALDIGSIDLVEGD